MNKPLKLAVSACFFHADAARPIFTGKTLLYIEQSVAHWVMSEGAMPVMVPSPSTPPPSRPSPSPGTSSSTSRPVTFDAYADWLDGLVLMGGADLWPGSYGEEPLKPQWSGDRVRDEYELALTRAFVARGKPVLGVCRGLQLLNVAFGGSLYQDITTQHDGALTHRDAGLYDQNFHAVELVGGSRLASLYPGSTRFTVNSVHHQGIKQLAPGFAIEARSPEDGIIEAVRWQGPSFVAAVQWHPEFHRPPGPPGQIDDAPLLRDFLAEVAAVAQAAVTAK